MSDDNTYLSVTVEPQESDPPGTCTVFATDIRHTKKDHGLRQFLVPRAFLLVDEDELRTGSCDGLLRLRELTRDHDREYRVSLPALQGGDSRPYVDRDSIRDATGAVKKRVDDISGYRTSNKAMIPQVGDPRIPRGWKPNVYGWLGGSLFQISFHAEGDVVIPPGWWFLVVDDTDGSIVAGNMPDQMG